MPTPTPCLALHFLGGFKVFLDGTQLRDFGYDKVRALLAYVACEAEQVHPRERLADLLWPGNRPETARSNLRRTLHDLRAALGHEELAQTCLVAGRSSLEFNRKGPHWLDVDAFLQDLPAAQAGDTAALEQQLALYRGPFLDGLSLPDAPDFETWLEQRREQLQGRALVLLRQLAQGHEREGNLEQAIATRRRELALDPWSEESHRQLMRLLALSGQTSAALAQFETCRAVLDQELGVAPEAETQELLRRIRQGELAAQPPGQGERVAQERRLVCLLACEIAPPPEEDPELQSGALGAAHGMAMEILNQHGGYCVPVHMGRILAYFGYPNAHEDCPRRTVSAALSLARRRQEFAGLHFRAAAHSGWVVNDRRYNLPDTTGHLSRQVARLAEHTGWEEISVTPEMARLVEGYFLLTPVLQLGELSLQRIVGPSGATHRLEARARQLTPLVGRRRELRLLQVLWERTRRGQRQTLLLQGEAGIGKSRLVNSLIDALQDDGAWRKLRCNPESQHTPYHPITDLLQQSLDQQLAGQEDSPASRRQQLERWLAPPGSPLRPHLPALLELLGLGDPARLEQQTPAQRKQASEAAIIALLESLASRHPVLLVIEDIHWADPSTLELLRQYLAGGQLPTFILLTSRPEFPPLPGVRSLQLGALATRQAERLARLTVGGRQLDEQTLAGLLQKTDGVPLYIEEMARACSEHPGEQVPGTLWSLLASRLEGAGSEARRLAQQAAAIGRDFQLDLLRALWQDSPQKFAQGLERLQAADLIHPGDETRSRFKHALIRDAAYQTLPLAERKTLHARLAELLQGPFAALVAEIPERLAQHLAAAGQPLAAAAAWLRAGQLAASRSANQEALFHLESGLQQLAGQEQDKTAALELPLQAALGNLLIAMRGYGAEAAKACFSRALELSRVVQEDAELFPVTWGLWLGGRSCTPEAYPLEFAQQLERIARISGQPDQTMQVHYAYGNNLFWLARYEEARRHLESAIALGETLSSTQLINTYGEDTGISSMAFLSWIQLISGQAEAAQATSERSIQAARQLGHAHTLGFALTFATMLQRLMHRPVQAGALANELLALASRHDLGLWLASGSALKGWSMAVQGDARGLDAIRPAVAAARVAMVVVEGTFVAMETDACLHLGRYEECAAGIEEIIAVCRKREDLYYLPEFFRMRGEALLHCGPERHQEALDCLREAHALACSQQAPLFQWRALEALERHLDDPQEKTAAAQALIRLSASCGHLG